MGPTLTYLSTCECCLHCGPCVWDDEGGEGGLCRCADEQACSDRLFAQLAADLAGSGSVPADEEVPF